MLLLSKELKFIQKYEKGTSVCVCVCVWSCRRKFCQQARTFVKQLSCTTANTEKYDLQGSTIEMFCNLNLKKY